MTVPVTIRDLGRTGYGTVFDHMRSFTDARGPETPDEIWLTEHEGVFTQGQAGRAEHVLAPGGIPVVPSDRGGQVTYHGPGQIVAYLMFDLRRLELTVRGLVSGIERSIIALLAGYGVEAAARADAPGVYVAGRKIASLGLRVRRGCSYHGLALNVAMDLEPFGRINPCGLPGLTVTQVSQECAVDDLDRVRADLTTALAATFNLRVSNRDSPAVSAV